MSKRIRLRRVRGWRLPDGAISVARPSRWGNPFNWAEYDPIVPNGEGSTHRVSDDERRRWAVADLRYEILADPRGRYPTLAEIQRELAGLDLACYCPAGSPCHADLLLELANPAERTRP